MPSHLEDTTRTLLDTGSDSTLRLIWQDAQTRKFIQVGELAQLDDDSFSFAYTQGALHPQFVPLAEFPDLNTVYHSNDLPAFFRNRVMSAHRDTYAQYCGWLGLADAVTPMEVLARTGGGRATDTFHVVGSFRPSGGLVTGRFFASGIRYVQHADEQLKHLHVGQGLQLRHQPDNPVNDRALLIDAARDRPVGWVPDWLVDDVHDLLSQTEVVVEVEKVNLRAPSHLKLLCMLRARMPS